MKDVKEMDTRVRIQAAVRSDRGRVRRNNEDNFFFMGETMALSTMDEGAAQSGYAYSTILCISCCGRSMILSGDADAEGRILTDKLPPGLTLTGAYCLGEICPTLYKDGHATNRFHNCSITFCML